MPNFRHAFGRECRSLENQRFSDCTPNSCGSQRKFSLGARIFFDRGAIITSFPLPQAAIGYYARNTSLALLKNRLTCGFSPTRCFFAAPVSEKTECGVNAAEFSDFKLSDEISPPFYGEVKAYIIILFKADFVNPF